MCVCVCVIVGEKRKPTEPLHHEENKRPRVLGDIPMDLINEVMATIADPAAIPEVIVCSVCVGFFFLDHQWNSVMVFAFPSRPVCCQLTPHATKPPVWRSAGA